MARAHWIKTVMMTAFAVGSFPGMSYCVDIGAAGGVKGAGRERIKKILASEAVSVPTAPSGPTNAKTDVNCTYVAGGATSSLGHQVEYRFDWSDGTYSTWGLGISASHSWLAGGTYYVRAEARCQKHMTVMAVSSTVSVVIIGETIGIIPSAPSGYAGGTSGVSYTYTTGGAVSSYGHTVECRFNWGDGTYSNWGTDTGALHSWLSAGTYQVTAEARCQIHTMVTGISPERTVAIISPAPMVSIPAGTFNMGTTAAWADSLPIHSVYLDAYYMDKYEVTFDQYDAFCDATGRFKPYDLGWGRGNHPAIYIDWNNSKAYCEWAGKRLPTEAEWEYACRAGTNTVYYFGDNSADGVSYAWWYNNSSNMTHPVGEKFSNAYGLYDMHGNVWEWCADWYDAGYYSVSPSNNPKGPDSGICRVVRGGSWGGDLMEVGRPSGSRTPRWVRGVSAT